MPQYMLSVHHDGSDQYEKEDLQQVFEAVSRFNDRLRADGNWVFGGGLMPIGSARTVDGRTEQVLVTDGPFAETKEHLGGFWVIEAADEDAALTLAAEASAACRQAVELRPFQPE